MEHNVRKPSSYVLLFLVLAVKIQPVLKFTKLHTLTQVTHSYARIYDYTLILCLMTVYSHTIPIAK